MKVYIAILEDRHTDVKAEVFTTSDAAIKYAKTFAKANVSEYENIEEEEIEEWLYYARYSCEGDCVRVVESELDPELEE